MFYMPLKMINTLLSFENPLCMGNITGKKKLWLFCCGRCIGPSVEQAIGGYTCRDRWLLTARKYYIGIEYQLLYTQV